jgi:phosphatidylinositol alpha-1,6-mannosyltransferase
MKVLYVTPGCFDKGGISRYSRYQITALRELYKFDDIKVLSYLGPDDESFETPFHVNWHGSSSGIMDRIKLVFILVYYSFIFKPEVIHSAHVNYSGLVWFLSKLIRAKTILNVYGLEIWTNLNKHAKYGLKKTDFIISDCHATKEFILKNNLRKNPDDIDVIWDCVDTDKFFPVSTFPSEIIKKFNLPVRDKSFIISTLGRMSKDAAYKGYERLIKVFERVSKDKPDAYLLMIGRGDLVPYLKQLAAELNISQKVIFTGSVSDYELPILLSYGHIFSLVTENGDGMGEGLPLTPLEAMACGLPIIVGNQDGSREAIFDGINGYCINPSDLQAHEFVVNEILKDNNLLSEKSKNALGCVQKYFSYLSFKEKTSIFYKNKIKF